MSLKPYIQGTQVTGMEIDDILIPAKGDGVSIDHLADIIQAFNLLINYFDFGAVLNPEEQLDDWTRDEIYEFFTERNQRQILFFEILTEAEESERHELISLMAERLKRPNFTGKQLAGSLAGIGIRTNSLGKEALYVTDWRNESDGWHCYYMLAPSYRDEIINWFEDERVN